jgi:hypothetical protein
MERTVRTNLFIRVAAALALSSGCWCFAQQSAAAPARQLKGPGTVNVYDDSQPASNQNPQLFLKDLRSQKKQMVAANMNLTDAEAEKFWPVYDRYASDLAKVYDTKIALITDYVDNYSTMDGDQAESYIRRRAATEEEVMQLRLKYLPEFRKVLSGRQAALFFQIEWRLDLMINLQLAQAPLIDP